MLISFVVLQDHNGAFPALLGSDDGFQVGIVKLTAKDWFLPMFLPPVFCRALGYVKRARRSDRALSLFVLCSLEQAFQILHKIGIEFPGSIQHITVFQKAIDCLVVMR